MNNNILNWAWKWHFIGGLVSLPVIILLSVTGIIYLFKDSYEKPVADSMTTVQQYDNKLSYQEQLEIAKQNWKKVPTAIIVPESPDKATEFVSGKFSHKSSIYIDPYSGKITGKINLNETDMHKVRKLHGELLMGGFGTKIVELVGSWMVVLLISGIYIFLPRKKGLQGLFTIRFNASRRILFRDLHAVTGFWFSFILLLILAGGLPWTDIFGRNFSWLQEKTNTGYPATWDSRAFTSEVKGIPLNLDDMIIKAKSLNLKGKVNIHLPQSETSVFSVFNETNDLHSRKMVHFDQYSGQMIKNHSWEDIGILMRARLWAMAFHQGEFGLWNWILVLFTAIGLVILSVSAVFSYFLRKNQAGWDLPKLQSGKSQRVVLIAVVVLLGVVLPMFGLSVLVLGLVSLIKGKGKKVVRNVDLVDV